LFNSSLTLKEAGMRRSFVVVTALLFAACSQSSANTKARPAANAEQRIEQSFEHNGGLCSADPSGYCHSKFLRLRVKVLSSTITPWQDSDNQASAATAFYGNTLRYEVSVNNQGPVPLSGLNLVIKLNAGLDFRLHPGYRQIIQSVSYIGQDSYYFTNFEADLDAQVVPENVIEASVCYAGENTSDSCDSAWVRVISPPVAVTSEGNSNSDQ
jgi:uncharacterized repeat protein (TIGR01451 family)